MSAERNLARMTGKTKTVARALYDINAEDKDYPIIPPTAIPWMARLIAEYLEAEETP